MDGRFAAAADAFRTLLRASPGLALAHDGLFARVLLAAPSARLDVLCSKAPNVAADLERRMRAEFVRHGIDFDARCTVHPMQPSDRYHAFLDNADACLDSLDFSGCITSLDALWRDLPIVTLPGKLMRGRQTFGMLHLIELDELIAHDADDYVRIAARLTQDRTWRGEIAARIAARKAELYRDQSVVDALAAFLRAVEPRNLA
jgi:predicted O-linked N-acetylglucosamine transferase (SPINDLY family)